MTDTLAVRQQSLLRLDEARHLLAQCARLDDVKDIRDQAEAVVAYYRQRGASLGIQNDASEIRLRAERRLGELLKGMPKNQGGRPAETSASNGEVATLGDIGITHKQSSMWQKIASLPEDDFEERIAEAKENEVELTTSRLLKGVVLAAAQQASEEGEQLPEENRRVLEAMEALRLVRDQREAWNQAAQRLYEALGKALVRPDSSAERKAVEQAMDEVTECDSEDDGAYRRAWERFRNAALAWLANTAGGRGRLRAMYRIRNPSMNGPG